MPQYDILISNPPYIRSAEIEELMEELKKYLTLRGNAYDNRVGEYNRLARMKEYNSYLSCCEKFIDFQYRKDCCIADLQKFLTDESVLRFCREIPLDSVTIDTNM